MPVRDLFLRGLGRFCLFLSFSSVGAKPTVLIGSFREGGMYIKTLLVYAVLIPEVLNFSFTVDIDMANPN